MAPVDLGPFTAETLAGADLIAISPGVPQSLPPIAAAVAKGVELAGDIEIFARALPPAQKALAVTGSNGKSTVSALAGALCRAAGLTTIVAGNIGDAVLDVIAPFEAGQTWPDVFVLELSSFQLETTKSLAPAAAAVLNVTDNHLDRYTGMDEYTAAKARIFAGGGVQVLNRDDSRSFAMRIPGRTVESFGANVPAAEGEWGLVTFDGATWLARGGELLLPASSLALVGRHNALNALAALALVSSVARIDRHVIDALRSFAVLRTGWSGSRKVEASSSSTIPRRQQSWQPGGARRHYGPAVPLRSDGKDRTSPSIVGRCGLPRVL